MAETGNGVRKVRWGVIGATARIARDQVIPAILESEHGQLVALASRSLQHAQEATAACPYEVRAYGDYDSLIADGDVDVVYIPLPNNLHVGWAVEAMNNGKHILCETPLALNAAQALEMVETAEANAVILSEAFMYRYLPLQREIADLIAQRAVGDVELVRASFSFVQTQEDDYRRDPGMGGGALFDVGCYCVHIARHAFGREPTAVTAKSLYDPNTGIDTTTTMLLEFDQGGMALLDCSFSLAFRASYEIVGREGFIDVGKFFTRDRRDAAPYLLSRGTGAPEARYAPPGSMYLNEVEAMSRRVLGENVYLLPPEDGLANMRALDAVAASARSGQKVTV